MQYKDLRRLLVDSFPKIVHVEENENNENQFATNDIELSLGLEILDEWCCPLTLECFHDPVKLIEDEQIYERAGKCAIIYNVIGQRLETSTGEANATSHCSITP